MTVFMNQSNSSWRSMCFPHCSSGSKRLAAPPHGRKRNARRLVFASCQRIHLLDAKPPHPTCGCRVPREGGRRMSAPRDFNYFQNDRL